MKDANLYKLQNFIFTAYILIYNLNILSQSTCTGWPDKNAKCCILETIRRRDLRWKNLWLKWPKEYSGKYFQISKMAARGRNRYLKFFKSFFTEIYPVTVTKKYMLFKAYLYPSNFCLTLCDVSIKIKWWRVFQCFF